MPDRTFDVIVIGRGIIGASIAWRLAQAGLSVVSLDAIQRGQATKAAAGMLAALAESNSLPELAKLGIPSLAMYPDFVAELEAVSGVAVPLLGPGILRIASTEEDEEQLKETYSRQVESPFPAEFLTAEEARSLEPGLGNNVRSAVLSTAEKHVTPATVIEALTVAFKRVGVTELADTVIRLRRSGDSWAAELTGHSVEAKIVVVAAGVWTPTILAPLRFDAPISPLKGELLVMKYRRTDPPRHTIFAHSTYIVPRSSNEVILGATEDASFGLYDDLAAETTIEAVTDLRERGAKLLPTIAGASVQRGLVGIRPASPDRLPLIGAIPGLDNAYIAGGHGRNGILLAPITAKLVRDLIVDGIQPPSSVAPGRFAKS